MAFSDILGPEMRAEERMFHDKKRRGSRISEGELRGERFKLEERHILNAVRAEERMK